MRHKNLGRKLSRNSEHRYALLRNMAKSLIIHGSIRTTEAKAKELSRFADKLVSLTRTDDVHSRRLAYKILCNHQLVARLFTDIGPQFAGVPGGFTRVVKLGLPRAGDAAPMAIIELTRRPDQPDQPAEAAGAKSEAKAKAVAAKDAAKTASKDAAAAKAPEKKSKAKTAAPETGAAGQEAPEATTE
ncbi:MAG: 50S ribosomal protein L17 [Desulfovibrionaceae bacterium]|nr:50S ribosomal protein L17 [Desulfovibrionaceae bacterium]MBF0514375.1 50S ribosomal protein L17 [Desulfovibrionaceae bacterium]